MPSETVRVRPVTHAKLKQLARQSGLSMPQLLEKAIEAYRRENLLKEANRAYAALHGNARSWAEEQSERAEWDATLADGLEDD